MPDAKIKAVRLTSPQVELLSDITTKPMYITRWTRWDQTAQALMTKGLAQRSPGYHSGPYEITITELGRAEAARRGLWTSAPNPCTWYEGDLIEDVPDDYSGPCIHCRQLRDAHGQRRTDTGS